ncbi:MAG: hypothetical protein ABIJ23_00285 [Candidatus Magasanikbacteria bacterium]
MAGMGLASVFLEGEEMKEPVRVDVHVRGCGKVTGYACKIELYGGKKIKVFKKPGGGGKPIGTFDSVQVNEQR